MCLSFVPSPLFSSRTAAGGGMARVAGEGTEGIAAVWFTAIACGAQQGASSKVRG